ncbi:MAG: hypothetical protein ACFFD7_06465 [Candidatus Thorarchaeota archaeon]
MLFQNINEYLPFIIAVVFILVGIIIFKIGLSITKSESKTSFKWVTASFLIQYGVTLFISAPMLLDMLLAYANGLSSNYQGPPSGIIAIVIIFSMFIVVNLINLLHKPGIVRSIIIAILILGPIVGSNYIIFSNLGNVL